MPIQSDFTVVRFGSTTRILVDSFDVWLDSDTVYLVNEISSILGVHRSTVYYMCKGSPPFRILNVGDLIRIPQKSFDTWFHGLTQEE